MKWKELAEAALCFKELPQDPPSPIILSGVRNETPWMWTGDDGHIRHYEGASLVPDGEQATIVEDGKIIGWIAKIDDTPEIRDVEAFKQQCSCGRPRPSPSRHG